MHEGQTFKAPKDMVLAEEFVVLELQQELLDLVEAIDKMYLREDLE